jgi:hypothetical protein
VHPKPPVAVDFSSFSSYIRIESMKVPQGTACGGIKKFFIYGE